MGDRNIFYFFAKHWTSLNPHKDWALGRGARDSNAAYALDGNSASVFSLEQGHVFSWLCPSSEQTSLYSIGET